jgi:DUF1680 family protein
MSTSRRDFVQLSAAAAAGLTLHPRLIPKETLRDSTTLLREMRSAVAEKMVVARPVPLGSVRLTGGPLQHAQQITGKYLLSLDPDRMMAFYRVRAGLPPKAPPYGGWDGPGKNLTGHIAGHHLSAVSYMYQATGDAAFRARADYLVKEMKEVQDRNGDGYLSALENGREAWARVSKGDIRSQAFDLNGLWSPWYVLHKTFAGLRDAYRHTGNHTALDIEAKFAAWAEGVLAPLTDTQVQKMLDTEHGGMNEVLADLWADTGDRRWLTLSHRFEHHAFTDALKRSQDNLSGKHGNCQIPKLIGSAERYAYEGDSGDLLAAGFFWNRVTQHHSYVTGGHGLDEYFGPPDVLGARVNGRTCESCNVYNMLKLTRRMFSLRPDAFYADFHERALFNHILASIDPNDARVSYMVPVGRGVEQEYQDPQEDFTCCVGTGMESHALHGYGIYYESADTAWINLFAPSTAQFTLGGMTLTAETGFPDGDEARYVLKLPSPKAFTLAIRRPVWAGDDFRISVNGAVVEQPPLASLRDAAAGGRRNATGNEDTRQFSSYVELRRTWRSGDVVELKLPKTVRLEPTPDDPKVAAIMWGPLALAADWGPRLRERQVPVPVPAFVTGDRALDAWLVAGDRPGDFTARGVTQPHDDGGPAGDVSLAPFYRTQERRYSIYFDVLKTTP